MLISQEPVFEQQRHSKQVPAKAGAAARLLAAASAEAIFARRLSLAAANSRSDMLEIREVKLFIGESGCIHGWLL
ncbi:hypothetical protein [Rhodoferax sp.]|uniref:hypothetical protein n=1 Tax=Rhodoferax sp. TaxID=50421 RepID=UPI0025E060FC|nr:hypothetical protein [Rhodoferax sp.]